MDYPHLTEPNGTPALTIAFEPGTDRTLIIHLAGELDMDSADALHETLDQVLRHRFSRVVVNLSQLHFCDSSGIRALLLGHADADRLGCQFVAVAPRPFVRRVLELTGVTALLGIESTEAPRTEIAEASAPRTEITEASQTGSAEAPRAGIIEAI